jgi:hypothetical protein
MGADGAAVTFVHQPDLDTGHVRPILHKRSDELLKQLLQRLLVSDVQKQLRGQIGINPVFIDQFHKGEPIRKRVVYTTYIRRKFVRSIFRPALKNR